MPCLSALGNRTVRSQAGKSPRPNEGRASRAKVVLVGKLATARLILKITSSHFFMSLMV